jgi:hypothetical protein
VRAKRVAGLASMIGGLVNPQKETNTGGQRSEADLLEHLIVGIEEL